MRWFYIAVLLLLVVMSGFSIIIPVNSDSGVQTGFYDDVAYNYSMVLLGNKIQGWSIYKWNRKFDVYGILNSASSETYGGMELVKLFGFSMPDSFTYKPVAVEDSYARMHPNIRVPLGEKSNFLVLGTPSSVYLVGPMKYGGMGFYMSVYSYRKIELLSVRVLSGTDKGANITTYKDLESYLHKLHDSSALLFKVKIHPTVTNVVLVSDDRYEKWNSLKLDCNGTVGCEGKKYFVGWFSMLYQIGKLPPRGEEPKTISEYGMILTPFYNVTTWTYNPDFQYFVGSGTGIAWNASCKYSDHPTGKDKYTLEWMGPGDINEIYSLRIIGNPSEHCCHLPAYYINFLPLWCKAGKDYGELYYNVTSIINRVKNIPLGSASAYIPGTGVNVVYSNGQLYFFKINSPPQEQIHYTTMPMVVYFNTTVRWSYTLPQSKPELEKAIVPINLGSIRGIWFTSNKTMIVLDSNNKTIHLYLYNEPINKNPSSVLNPINERKISLKHAISAVAYNRSIIYLASKDGAVYKINGIQVSQLGTIKPNPINIGVYGKYLAVLYNDRLILYSTADNLEEKFEAHLSSEYKWIVPSTHYIFVIGDNHTEVYSLEPKVPFLSGTGIGEAKITVNPSVTTSVPSQETTSNLSQQQSRTVESVNNSNSPTETTSGNGILSKEAIAAFAVVLIVLFLVGYYYFRNK